jgi:hypothetical protein
LGGCEPERAGDLSFWSTISRHVYLERKLFS